MKILTAAIVALVAVSKLALAAGGWYLMLPPLSKYDESAPFLKAYKVLQSEPISKWSQAAAFDKASQCESEKLACASSFWSAFVRSQKNYQEMLGLHDVDKGSLAFERQITEQYRADTDQYAFGLCIASDDPRLSVK